MSNLKRTVPKTPPKPDPTDEMIKRAMKVGIWCLVGIMILVFVVPSMVYRVPKGSVGCKFSNLNGWDFEEKSQDRPSRLQRQVLT